MINRGFAACTACQHKYLLRYNMGNKFPQSATFHCIDCGELLEVGYDANRNNFLKNMVKIEEDYAATVRNLHPELAIDPAFVSDPTYFPNLDFLRQSIKKGGGFPQGFVKLRQNQISAEFHQIEWDKVATNYRYLKEDRWTLLEKSFGKDRPKAKKRILKDVIDAGRHFLTGKWNDQYRTVLSELEKAKRHADYSNLKAFLVGLLDDILLDKMFAVMQEYRRVESVFLPTLLSLKTDIKPVGLSSSVSWDEIEMTYGNFYEIYGDLLLIPTTINNLLLRNDYRLFATPGFTLKQYTSTDKSGRCANFLSNTNLAVLEEFYDSNLRNGTHHKTARIDKSNQSITIKTGRGGNTTRVVSFVEYSEYCNEIYAHCLILFNIFYKAVY